MLGCKLQFGRSFLNKTVITHASKDCSSKQFQSIFAVHQGTIRKSNIDHEDHPGFFEGNSFVQTSTFLGVPPFVFVGHLWASRKKTRRPCRFSSRSKTPHVESISDHWHLSTVHRVARNHLLGCPRMLAKCLENGL